jgi:hypothetical protein
MKDGQRFSTSKLALLREELLQSGLDSWQAGELLEAFLVVHGYGVSKNEAQSAASRIGSVGFSLVQVREELEKLALFM